MIWGSTDKDTNAQINREEEKEDWGISSKNTSWESSNKQVGIDLGYGYVKYLDGKQSKMFPSVVGLGNTRKYQSAISLDLDPLDDLSITIGNDMYFVGDLANRQSEVASRSLGKDRAKDKNAQVLMLTTLSLLCHWDKQSFNLVTGLPTNYYSAFYQSWKETLKGEFYTKLHISGKTIERSFQVENVNILPQPLGSLYDQVLNSVGKVVDQQMIREKIGVIDVGFKTTDIAVTDNMEFIDPLSSSTNTALSNVYRLVNEKLRQEFRVDKEDHQLDNVINSKKIRIAGETYDISEWVEEAFQIVSDKLVVELNSKWDFRDFDRILLTGGGGEVLSPYLLEKFPNMVLTSSPQLANVSGFQKLANNIFAPLGH